jgi:flagellar biosynthesis protein FlhA
MLQQVLRLLLEERVSIRNLTLILEAIAEVYTSQASAEVICEHVRHRIGFQLVAGIQEPDGAVPLIQLAPAWEELFQKYQMPEGSGIVDVALPPGEFNRLAASIAERIAHAGAQGRYPAVITSTKRRRFLHTVLTAKGIRNPVLSFEEIGTNTRPAVLGLA